MLNWWFVGRQTIVDAVLGPWTGIFMSCREKAHIKAHMA